MANKAIAINIVYICKYRCKKIYIILIFAGRFSLFRLNPSTCIRSTTIIYNKNFYTKSIYIYELSGEIKLILYAYLDS